MTVRDSTIDPSPSPPSDLPWTDLVSDIFLGEGDDGDDLCDVTFVVQAEEEEEQEVRYKVGITQPLIKKAKDHKKWFFQAHKLLLSLRSPVFRAMFFGSLKESSAEIAITDVTPTAFKAMLLFIYRGVAALHTLQGAWQLWYAAKKYMLDSLEEKCRKV